VAAVAPSTIPVGAAEAGEIVVTDNNRLATMAGPASQLVFNFMIV
jgi:hypothetical protein